MLRSLNVQGLLKVSAGHWRWKSTKPNILSWNVFSHQEHKDINDSLCLNSCSCSSYSAHQSSRHMQKLLNKKGGKTTKKRWFESHFAEPLESPAPKVKKGHSHRHMARVRQVSHVLYDKISHVINSGELCQDLLEKQVFITSVLFHKDMHGINVYWEADRTDWREVEEMLEARRGKLRSLLISYHVLGKIPPITFVRSKSFHNMTEIDSLLEAADYGPDYVPGQSPKELQLRRQEEGSEASALNHLGQEGNSLKSRQWEPNTPKEDLPGSQENNTESEERLFVESLSKGFEIDNRSPHGFPPQESSGGLNFQALGDTAEDAMIENDRGDMFIAPELKFRSDLYGLRRDEMMNKILAKKKGVPIVLEGELPPALPKLDLVIKKNFITSKRFLEQKALRKESKWKSKLLDREDF